MKTNLLAFKIKNFKTLKDIYYTFLFQLINTLFALLTTRLISEIAEVHDFGIFMIIKRIITIGEPIITLNFIIGLVRYISSDKNNAEHYLRFTIYVTSLMFGLMFLISIFFSQFLSSYFFSSKDYTNLIIITGIFIYTNAIFGITNGYYRGGQKILKSNILLLLYHSLPFALTAIFSLFIKNGMKLISIHLIIYSVVSILLSVECLYSKNIFKTMYMKYYRSFRPLVKFSLGRLPAGFLLTMLFAYPVFNVSKQMSLTEAGYMGIVATVVKLFEIIVYPVNFVFLPRFSFLKIQASENEIKKKVELVIDFVISVFPVLAITSASFTKYIILVMFGSKYLLLTKIISISLIFSIFYLAYVALRGIIDGLYEYPFVNIILGIGLASVIILSSLLNIGFDFFVFSFLFGLCIVGIISIMILSVKLGIPLMIKRNFIHIVALLIVTISSVFVDYVILFYSLHSIIEFVALLLSNGFLLIIYFTTYAPRKTLWGRYLKNS